MWQIVNSRRFATFDSFIRHFEDVYQKTFQNGRDKCEDDRIENKVTNQLAEHQTTWNEMKDEKRMKRGKRRKMAKKGGIRKARYENNMK